MHGLPAKLVKIEPPPKEVPAAAVAVPPVVESEPVEVYSRNGKRLGAKKIQSRSWKLVIPFDWANLEGIKSVGRKVSRNFYYIMHDKDVNELGEPVKNHWHLLLSFSSSRDLSTVRNYFFDYSVTDDQEAAFKLLSLENPSFRNSPENLPVEYKDRLFLNSFEKVFDIKQMKRYLVHFDDPSKYQYNFLDVETNDKKYCDLFLDFASKVEEARYLHEVMDQAGEFDRFGDLYSCLERDFARMSPSARLSGYINLRRYYKDMKAEYIIEKSKDDGYVPYDEKNGYIVDVSSDDPLPF
jgi:hypothetical protein